MHATDCAFSASRLSDSSCVGINLLSFATGAAFQNKHALMYNSNFGAYFDGSGWMSSPNAFASTLQHSMNESALPPLCAQHTLHLVQVDDLRNAEWIKRPIHTIHLERPVVSAFVGVDIVVLLGSGLVAAPWRVSTPPCTQRPYADAGCSRARPVSSESESRK